MSTSTPTRKNLQTSVAISESPLAQMHRFSVVRYHKMIDAGILTVEDKVELLEGLVLNKISHHPSHAGTNLSILHEQPHLFTSDDYERMTELGILNKDDRVELLEGVIVDKMTQKPPHNVAVDLTRAALDEQLPEGWRLREQKAIRLLGSEPEPDIAVVRGPIRRYATRHPIAKDIGMLVEV